MHEALHLLPQRLQAVHLLSSMVRRNSEKRLKMLSRLPTGQMVLQYARPRVHARNTSSTKVIPAVMSSAGAMLSPSASPAMLLTMRP